MNWNPLKKYRLNGVDYVQAPKQTKREAVKNAHLKFVNFFATVGIVDSDFSKIDVGKFSDDQVNRTWNNLQQLKKGL